MVRAARIPRALGLSAALWLDLLGLGLLGLLGLAGCAASSGRAIADEAAAPVDQAATLASACSGCHHAGGSAIADLQAYSALQIEQSLRAYKQAVDWPTAMHRMARGYTDAEISAIARRLGR